MESQPNAAPSPRNTPLVTRWPVSLREALFADRHSLLAIARASFEHTWSLHDFDRHLVNKKLHGMVATYGSGRRIVGFAISELLGKELYIVNLAVDPIDRRRGVGRQMIDWLKAQTLPRCEVITVEIRESNLQAQLFFRAMGFRCARILRGFYTETGEDAYFV